MFLPLQCNQSLCVCEWCCRIFFGTWTCSPWTYFGKKKQDREWHGRIYIFATMLVLCAIHCLSHWVRVLLVCEYFKWVKRSQKLFPKWMLVDWFVIWFVLIITCHGFGILNDWKDGRCICVCYMCDIHKCIMFVYTGIGMQFLKISAVNFVRRYEFVSSSIMTLGLIFA